MVEVEHSAKSLAALDDSIMVNSDRIIVFGCTTNSASCHSKSLARIAKLIRVAASIRRG
jgi:hypothetical protein